jgi:thioredoxin reductase
MQVVVVGGGDSAIEAAVAIAEQPGTGVILSYRGEAVGRVKTKNRDRVKAAETAGRLRVALNSRLLAIAPEMISIEEAGVQQDIRNDAVIVCAGGILPTPMLRELGIRVEAKFGTE